MENTKKQTFCLLFVFSAVNAGTCSVVLRMHAPLRGDYHAWVAKGGCPPFVASLYKLQSCFRLAIPTRSSPISFFKNKKPKPSTRLDLSF